jgi:hypothetical protein
MPPTPKQYAADYVDRIPEITLTMEDGTHCTFRWSREVVIPADLLAQKREYLRAPAQIAFWAYQTERALRDVRDKEKALAAKEGEMNLVYRQWYTSENQEYTEGQIRARVDTDGVVATAREDLNSARNMYGTLRSLRDAVEHRVHVLRQLTTHFPGQSG